jgi:hypothetical protein
LGGCLHRQLRDVGHRLEQDGLILDIAADQFADIDEPVLLTRDRSWHG